MLRKAGLAMLLITFMAAIILGLTRLPGTDLVLATRIPETLQATRPPAMPTQATAMPSSTPMPGSLAAVSVVASTALHLRACPSVDCQVLGFLLGGDRVLAMHCQHGWAQLPHGWVNARYLEPNPCKE